MEIKGVECCFCEKNEDKSMLHLTISSANQNEDEGEQFLFCHARCLKEKLRNSIPFLFDEE